MNKFKFIFINYALIILLIIGCFLILTEAKETNYENSVTTIIEDITNPGRYDWVTLLVAMASLVVSLITYNSQEKVAENTRQVSLNVQRDFLFDLVRHLYRNMVVMWAITNMVRENKYKIYPSSLHLLKAQIPIDDIHPELFVDNDDKYKIVNKLLLQARNYNIELEEASKVFENSDLSDEVKEYYIKTLLLKPAQITNLVIEVLESLSYSNSKNSPKSNINNIITRCKSIIESSHNKNIVDNKDCERKNITIANIGETKYFDKLYNSEEEKILFKEILNEDAYIECGKNKEGGDKLLMIKYKE